MINPFKKHISSLFLIDSLLMTKDSHGLKVKYKGQSTVTISFPTIAIIPNYAYSFTYRELITLSFSPVGRLGNPN